MQRLCNFLYSVLHFWFRCVWCGVMQGMLLPITLMHKYNSDKSMTIKIAPLFNFKCTELTLCNSFYQVCWITSVRVHIKAGKNIFKFHCFTMLKLSFGSRHGSIVRLESLRMYKHSINKQELIRRWDSERELFHDDIAHVLQNTEKRIYFV